jgi:hypothetical protein
MKLPNNHNCAVCHYWDKQSDEQGWCRFDRNPDGKISTKRDFCCGDMYIFNETKDLLVTFINRIPIPQIEIPPDEPKPEEPPPKPKRKRRTKKEMETARRKEAKAKEKV